MAYARRSTTHETIWPCDPKISRRSWSAISLGKPATRTVAPCAHGAAAAAAAAAGAGDGAGAGAGACGGSHWVAPVDGLA